MAVVHGGVTLAFDGSELTDMTAAVVGPEDELDLITVLTEENLLAKSNLDSLTTRWTSNVGDIRVLLLVQV